MIVYDADDGGSVVAALDPDAMLGVVDNPTMREVASDARKRLETALNAL